MESGRDRNGTFEPKIVAKRQLIITEELEDNVLAMYARGMSMPMHGDPTNVLHLSYVNAEKSN
nr:transposase [Sphingobacterium bovisgrunnientis]